MKFGKLDDISGVDFQLPANLPDTESRLSPFRSGNPLHLYIGGTGWTMKEWVGKVYPPGTKANAYLRQYCQQFNTIELNTTHYRIPDPATIQRWYAESTADFRFCPKIPQTVSHSQDLGLQSGQLLAFCEAVAGLQEKLGCCFIQLPPYFGYERFERLRRFLKSWPREIPLAVEFRHESWFEEASAFEALAQQGISAVITDVAGRRDVLHMQLTTPVTMIRFVGNGLHPSDYQRIDQWVERLQQWQQWGLSEAYFFTHEPDNILAPELARYLWEKVRDQGFALGRGPQFFGEDRQMSLF